MVEEHVSPDGRLRFLVVTDDDGDVTLGFDGFPLAHARRRPGGDHPAAQGRARPPVRVRPAERRVGGRPVLGCRYLPQPRCIVPAAGEQGATVGAEGHCPHGTLVAQGGDQRTRSGGEREPPTPSRG